MASLEFPLSFNRQYAGPLDDYYVFSTTNSRNSFTTNARKYEGLISYDVQLKKVFVLKNNSNTWAWEELAQGTSAVTTLSGLTDTIITSPSSNQYLKYNGSKWINSAIAIGDVTDLSTTIDTINTNIGTKQASLNGTGFVKANGTNISYDSNTYALASALSAYLTTTNATNTYLPIIAGTGSGSSNITLDFSSSDSVFGSSTAVSGSITMNVTGAKLGVTHIVIHNGTSYSLSAGSSTLVKLTGSGNFKSGVTNYIYFTFIGNSTIIYSINQAV